MLLEIPIGSNDAGQRAERFLRKYLPSIGLSRLHSLFRRKEIKVAKKAVERGHVLRAGDVLQVYGLKPEEAQRPDPAQPVPIHSDPVPVVHEDDEILVVNKPAGVASHPGTGIEPGASLIERVLAQLGGAKEQWSGEVFSPSLVHRLDKETSGVLLIAKTGPRLRELTAALRNGEIRKRYLALVVGHPQPASGEIDAPLERGDSASGAKSRIEEGGRRAFTQYRTVKTVGDYALLQVVIETGRMHQIRAHLSHIGHPIVGDTRYDKPADARRHLRELGLKRLFLHAEELAWEENGKMRTFRAPLPEDLQKIV